MVNYPKYSIERSNMVHDHRYHFRQEQLPWQTNMPCLIF